MGINREWKIDIYGLFEEIELNYPKVSIRKGVLDMEKIKVKVQGKDKTDPFYYIDKHLIIRIEEEGIE